MKNGLRIIMAVSVLALAALACQAVSGGGGDNNSDAPSAPEIPLKLPTKGPDVILEDDFSSSQWGTGTDADSAVEYVNNALNFAVFNDFYFVWSTPDKETYQDVHIEVTVQNDSTDPLATFGIICNLQLTDTSNYFAVTGSGKYVIARSSLTGDDVVLTNDGKWVQSDFIRDGASSYRIGADCGSDGTLTLYVDGNKVDSVSDTTYTSGQVGLFAWSDEQASGTNVTYDDFLMTELP